MRVRTFVGILFALAVVVAASYATHQNIELLRQPFRLTAERAVPLWGILVTVFLAGFLPVVTVLLIETLKRDLAQRRDRRLSREARSLRGSFRRAVDLQVDGQWGRALVELERVLADQPEDFAALLRYGEVLRHQGRAAEAVEVHRRASVLYPQSVAVLYELAEDYQAAGEPAVAEQLHDRILRDFPGSGLTVLRRLRNAALGRQQWAEAARLQEKVDRLLDDNGGGAGQELDVGVRRGLAYQQGVAELGAERVADAKRIFLQLAEEEPRFLPAHIMLGECALLEDAPEAAVAAWRRGFELTGSPTFLQRIEDHYIEREEPLEAMETLHQLIAGAENDLMPRFFLGRLYYRLEMHAEALKALKGVAERVHSSPTYYLLLARIHQRRGEMARAVEACLTCIGQAGVDASEYRCAVCHNRYPGWVDRCDACGSWNSVELDFEEERLSPEEAGVRERPVWQVDGES